MRGAAIILIIIFLAAAVLTGYLYATAQITVTGIDCSAVSALDQGTGFQALKEQIKDGTFTGTAFQTDEIGEPSEYQFYTYSVHLMNSTFLRAEVAEIQITPMNGDILQTEETTVRNIPARSRGSVQATLLTKKDMHSVREITVTYYLWGLPFHLRTTYSR